MEESDSILRQSEKEKTVKPKRQLSEKQKAALARGREIAREKTKKRKEYFESQKNQPKSEVEPSTIQEDPMEVQLPEAPQGPVSAEKQEVQSMETSEGPSQESPKSPKKPKKGRSKKKKGEEDDDGTEEDNEPRYQFVLPDFSEGLSRLERKLSSVEETLTNNGKQFETFEQRLQKQASDQVAGKRKRNKTDDLPRFTRGEIVTAKGIPLLRF